MSHVEHQLVYPEARVWSWLEEELFANVLQDLPVQTAVKVLLI